LYWEPKSMMRIIDATHFCNNYRLL